MNRQDIINQISDSYKDLNGFRPRWSWDRYTDAELEAELNDIFDQLDRQMKEEIEDERKHKEAVDNAMTPKSLPNTVLGW